MDENGAQKAHVKLTVEFSNVANPVPPITFSKDLTQEQLDGFMHGLSEAFASAS